MEIPRNGYNLMTKPSLAVSLYLLNGAILLTHEIDSAYWKEWQLFGTGGGIQSFLAINFLMALAILVGLDQLVRGKRAGHVFSLVLAASGIFAFTVHTWFLSQGRPEFNLPASKIVLGATLIVSLVQGYVAYRGLRR
jgi:hypothetical protein